MLKSRRMEDNRGSTPRFLLFHFDLILLPPILSLSCSVLCSLESYLSIGPSFFPSFLLWCIVTISSCGRTAVGSPAVSLCSCLLTWWTFLSLLLVISMKSGGFTPSPTSKAVSQSLSHFCLKSGSFSSVPFSSPDFVRPIRRSRWRLFSAPWLSLVWFSMSISHPQSLTVWLLLVRCWR